MEKVILEKLNEIERRENVRILYAAESGSRAWGFASHDSDYDVRFIYVRPKEYYLRLDQTRDVIEWQLDDTLDINGWDIQKALTLLHRSNPTLFEWNASPIVYKTTEAWQGVSAVFDRYFIPRAGLHHYLNTAKSNYREHLRADTVRLKKYFYVLRPLLACKWILATGERPPMAFRTLMEAYLDESIVPAVERLLAQKINTPEITLGKRLDDVNAYLDYTVAEIEERLAVIPEHIPQPWDELNALFLQLLTD